MISQLQSKVYLFLLLFPLGLINPRRFSIRSYHPAQGSHLELSSRAGFPFGVVIPCRSDSRHFYNSFACSNIYTLIMMDTMTLCLRTYL